ncbi:ABC transporter substrate-binding protein [Cohnella hashimotonis]|uniref:ABC transporter substrate-binding protein n=1 Tax=Cohnella hashimotonis TaxID=2826895 RepID=A0ABT6TWB6_9BACL|nr:ABC transporter substrate-binding protein [Cohnella hashimotonis]
MVRTRTALPAISLCLLLSGCFGPSGGDVLPGASGDGPAPVVLSFWNPFGGGEGEFVERIIGDFNASQDAVFVKQLRLESNEYYARLGTALSFGSGPDVAVVHADRLAPLVKAGRISELDGLAEQAGFRFEEIDASNVQSVVFGGKHYAIPLDTHFHMLYYNKDILAKAGALGGDDTPDLGEATPEGFVRFLRQIRERVPDVQPFAVNTPYFQEPFLDLYYEAGGDLLSPDGTRAAIAGDAAVRVLAFYQRLFAEGLSDLNDKTPWDSFDKGRAGLWFGGVWEAGHYLANPALNVGIMPLPPIFGSDVHWGSSHTLAIPAYATGAKRDAAMAFIKYFSEVGSVLWGEAGHIPANTAVMTSAEYQALPYRKLFVRSQRTVKPAPKTDKYAALLTALSEELQSIIQNRTEPASGLAAAERRLNEILSN